MNKTITPSLETIERNWFLVDAKDKTLGRLATEIATVLRGKNKPTFTPHLDTGDFVIVVNAEKVEVTGKKASQKLYRRHSGRPGGMKIEKFESLQDRIPERIIEQAVKGMLPHNSLGRQQFKKLKVYKGADHPHAAQNPVLLNSWSTKMNSQIKNKAVYWGTGRRKTSVARVRLIPGNGLIKINGRSGDDYLNFNPLHLNSVKAPLQTLGLENSYDVLVNVFGGGLTGQADAIKQGAARALCELSPDNRKPLKTEGHLSRDPRAKERRKYGLKKARKAPQFSKR